MEKGSSDGAFNVPALLQPGEARGRRAFPIKQHNYGGGVLSDSTAIKIEGASPPKSRHLAMGGGVAPTTHTSRHIG
jgi:hypothetical protein